MITSTQDANGLTVSERPAKAQQGTVMRDFGLDVAAGNIAGVSGGRAFGYNASAGTTAEMIWAESGTAYPWPTAATVCTVSSANIADTAAGTGARTVRIVGLDAAFNEITEVVTLNGMTAVSTVNAYFRINSFTVVTAGSGGRNAGIVYVGTGAVVLGKPASVLFSIDTGMNGGLQAMYTVPNGKVLSIAGFFLAFSAAGVLQLWTRPANGLFVIASRLAVPACALSVPQQFQSAFPAGTDIYLAAAATTGTIAVGARFEYFLRDV